MSLETCQIQESLDLRMALRGCFYIKISNCLRDCFIFMFLKILMQKRNEIIALNIKVAKLMYHKKKKNLHERHVSCQDIIFTCLDLNFSRFSCFTSISEIKIYFN